MAGMRHLQLFFKNSVPEERVLRWAWHGMCVVNL